MGKQCHHCFLLHLINTCRPASVRRWVASQHNWLWQARLTCADQASKFSISFHISKFLKNYIPLTFVGTMRFEIKSFLLFLTILLTFLPEYTWVGNQCRYYFYSTWSIPVVPLLYVVGLLANIIDCNSQDLHVLIKQVKFSIVFPIWKFLKIQITLTFGGL